MPIVRNADAFPIIVVELRGYVSIADLDEHFAAVELLRQRGKILTLNDAREGEVSSFSVAQRRRAAEGYSRLVEKFGGQFFIGEAFVFSSQIVKGMVAAVHWLAPSAWPIKHFSDLPPAMEWARTMVNGDPLRRSSVIEPQGPQRGS